MRLLNIERHEFSDSRIIFTFEYITCNMPSEEIVRYDYQRTTELAIELED